jgi:hypothetical protein
VTPITAKGRPPRRGPPWRRLRAGTEVGSQHDVGIENVDEGVEVAGTGRPEEGVDYRSLAGEVGLRNPEIRSLHTATGPAGELPCGRWSSTDRGSDLVERQLEHVVQDEREALGRSERVEYHKEREAD